MRALNLPNRLSLLRLSLVPPVALFIAGGERVPNLPAAALVMAASLSDWLDGFVARRRRLTTSLGRMLDPLADKLLVSVCLILLIPQVPAWMVALVVGRELAVTGLRGIALAQGLQLVPSPCGKVKTALQLMGIVAVLVGLRAWGLGLLGASLVASYWSAMGYMRHLLQAQA